MRPTVLTRYINEHIRSYKEGNSDTQSILRNNAYSLKFVLLITQEIANVNNYVTLLTKNIICGLKRKVDFSDFYHVDIFAYDRFKLASGVCLKPFSL